MHGWVFTSASQMTNNDGKIQSKIEFILGPHSDYCFVFSLSLSLTLSNVYLACVLRVEHFKLSEFLGNIVTISLDLSICSIDQVFSSCIKEILTRNRERKQESIAISSRTFMARLNSGSTSFMISIE